MIDNNEIILPKGYISWSQLEIWEKSPERYKREYFTDGSKLDTDALRFGKFIASSIERVLELEKEGYNKLEIIPMIMSELAMDYLTAETLVNLEKGEVAEHKMFQDIKGIKCLSFIDSYYTDTSNFREYKTGKIPWTQAKVQKHGQLLFYATMLTHISGKMPHHCHLDWIETENVERGEMDGLGHEQPKLKLTGRITTFEREFDSREIDGMEQRIVRVATEISNAYKQYLSEQF